MKILNRYVLTVLCGALAFGCSKPADAPADKAVPEAKAVEVKRTEKGDVVVTVSDEAQKRIDLKLDELKPTRHEPELTAYGTVLDPAPLITAQNEIATIAVALETSKKAAARAKALFDQGENVARKTLESADADVKANEIKLKSFRQQIALDWGDGITKLSPTELQSLISDVLNSKLALVRVDVPTGEMISGELAAARISTLNSTQWQTAKVISSAPKVDPKTQGQGFILQCSSAQLRPGAAVTALLQTAGTPQQGVIVPEAAMVQLIGKAWSYVQTGTNSFTRQEISLATPVDGGWFQISTNSLKAGDRVIVQGAQELLSEEQKAQISID
jgi:multidrug efflux system membrane fusion protein